MKGDKNCTVQDYWESDELDKDGAYRWIVEKRGTDDKNRPIYSIRNVKNKRRMNFQDDGTIVLPEKKDVNFREYYDLWKEEERDLWLIEPL